MPPADTHCPSCFAPHFAYRSKFVLRFRPIRAWAATWTFAALTLPPPAPTGHHITYEHSISCARMASCSKIVTKQLHIRTWLSRALCANGVVFCLSVCVCLHSGGRIKIVEDKESARDYHVLALNFAKYSDGLKNHLRCVRCVHCVKFSRNARIARTASKRLALNHTQASCLRCTRCVWCVRCVWLETRFLLWGWHAAWKARRRARLYEITNRRRSLTCHCVIAVRTDTDSRDVLSAHAQSDDRKSTATPLSDVTVVELDIVLLAALEITRERCPALRRRLSALVYCLSSSRTVSFTGRISLPSFLCAVVRVQRMTLPSRDKWNIRTFWNCQESCLSDLRG